MGGHRRLGRDALGGPPTDQPVGIAVTPTDAARARSVLVSAGLRGAGYLDGCTHRFLAAGCR